MEQFATRLLIIVSVAGILLHSCSGSSKAKPTELSLEEQQIALGKKLFFDKRLSSDNTISCASCHIPEKAFTNGLQFGVGVDGQLTDRNVPTVINSRFLKKVMFDGEVENLERQIIVPVQEHKEMNSLMGPLVQELIKDTYYRDAARKLYKREFDAFVLTRSIATYERSLVRMNSKFDKAEKGQIKLTTSERNGKFLFTTKLHCTTCHPGPHFTTFGVASNGLYSDYGSDQGRHRVTLKEEDRGVFKIPSLRNCAETAPYMHDGSMKTLEDVIHHYETGGKRHPNQHPVIKPFHLTERERKDLVSFLKTLSDN